MTTAIGTPGDDVDSGSVSDRIHGSSPQTGQAPPSAASGETGATDLMDLVGTYGYAAKNGSVESKAAAYKAVHEAVASLRERIEKAEEALRVEQALARVLDSVREEFIAENAALRERVEKAEAERAFYKADAQTNAVELSNAWEEIRRLRLAARAPSTPMQENPND
jgi:hypothetical protein